jgi:hypothetical protein
MPALPSAPGTCSMHAHQTNSPGAVEEKPFTSSVNICPEECKPPVVSQLIRGYFI